MSIAFLGGGNMANALVGGLVAKGYDARSISVIDIRSRQLPYSAFRSHLFSKC